jgi:hypothetical protein
MGLSACSSPAWRMGGWMILNAFSFRWDLALATMAGLGLVMLSFLLVPYYAEPPEQRRRVARLCPLA